MNILVYTLLPVVFMIHEFEEIIFLKYWINKDKDYLHNKFPKIGPFIHNMLNFQLPGLPLQSPKNLLL